MIKVWILWITIGGANPAVIDNIATKAECWKLEKSIAEVHNVTLEKPRTFCLEVGKIDPTKSQSTTFELK